MSDKQTGQAVAPVKAQVLEKIRPTLFIALGGTGMKVSIRLRRRILNAVWAGNSKVQQIADFPIAQFINLDLDSGDVTQDGKSVKTDLLAEQVAFTSEEKIVERLDINKYVSSADELKRHRHVAEWFPLTPVKLRELQIDPSKGAGQIRALSRLYFFDKYPIIRDRIRDKLERLLSNVGAQADRLKKLGLEIESGKVRVVVIGSAAGGTGSGTFLDTGYLVKALLQERNIDGKVDLFLLLPGGFIEHNVDRVQANGYAALMELETAMRGSTRLVTRWDDGSDNLPIAARPYDEAYIIDNANLAQVKTDQQQDVYEMLADAMFTDFTSQDFAAKKRSIAVNQNQHKLNVYTVRLPEDYGSDNEVRFPSFYSSLGQATLDTHIDARQNIRLNERVQQMLRAFFGMAVGGAIVNRPQDTERDAFMSEQLAITANVFTDLPKFLSDPALTQVDGEFQHFQVADDLLQVEGGHSILTQIEQRADTLFEQLTNSGADRDQWVVRVREIQQLLERDVKGNRVDSAERNHEVRIRETRQRKLVEWLKEDAVPAQLFKRLDDDARGGLDYTLSLVEMIKDRLENDATGVIPALEKNALRFAELSEKLESSELSREFTRLQETTGKGLFARISGKEKQAETVLSQLKESLRDSLSFYARAVAAREAAVLLREFSEWLGAKQGVDRRGKTAWSGFVGRLQAGRNAVDDLIEAISLDIRKTVASVDEKHATLIPVIAPIREEAAENDANVRTWAKEAFKDFGGSRSLFDKLQSDAGREELFVKLRAKALQHMPVSGATDAEDPLLAGLALLTPEQQREKFQQLLTRAMPWVPLNMNGGFGIVPDRFVCLIGVHNAKRFEELYGPTLAQCVPQGTGLTAGKISFVESGMPGKLICYVELSGFPAPALTPLSTYKASYRKETRKIPLHGHKRISQFVQPIQHTQDDYRRFAEDFKLFLKAVALGVLKREGDQVAGSGDRYYLNIDGEDFAIGDEFAVRQHGLDDGLRSDIEEQVRKAINALTDPLQLSAVAVLFEDLRKFAYKSAKRADELGAESLFHSFPSTIAGILSTEFDRDAERLGAKRIGDDASSAAALKRSIATWTRQVVGSRADVYADEVDTQHTEKRQLQADFMKQGWLAQQVGALSATAGVGVAGVPGAFQQSPPPAPPAGLPPGPPLAAAVPTHQYHLSVSGQNYGPYGYAQLQQFVPTQQVHGDSLLWREGLAGWLPARQIPELASLFGPPAAAGAAVPPPPPPSAPPSAPSAPSVP